MSISRVSRCRAASSVRASLRAGRDGGGGAAFFGAADTGAAGAGPSSAAAVRSATLLLKSTWKNTRNAKISRIVSILVAHTTFAAGRQIVILTPVGVIT